MEIKGTSVKGTYDFVKNNFQSRFQEWMDALPESSRQIMSSQIQTNKWYSIQEGLIAPIETISMLFYNGDDQFTAFYMGKYHAEKSLKGIYKFFIRLNNPVYIVGRGVEVFNTYFRPSKIEVETRNPNSAIIHIHEYEIPHKIIESSIEGWAQKAIEISGGKNVQTEIIKSLTKNEGSTEILLYWED